jgi:hypothetical protein
VDRVVGDMLAIVRRCTDLEVDVHQRGRGVRRTDLGACSAHGHAAAQMSMQRTTALLLDVISSDHGFAS